MLKNYSDILKLQLLIDKYLVHYVLLNSDITAEHMTVTGYCASLLAKKITKTKKIKYRLL